MTCKKGLFRLCLSIDRFGKVTELFSNMDYSPDSGRRPDPVEAFDRAELGKKGLHVFAVNRSNEKNQYLFAITDHRFPGQALILQGINLDSDLDKRQCADDCLALRKELSLDTMAFKPGLVCSRTTDM